MSSKRAKKIKVWFTLLEMLIVVIIIGVLMLVGMWLNRSQLKSLKSTTTIEEVRGAFDSFFLQILNSSSLSSHSYSHASLTVQKGHQGLATSFESSPEEGGSWAEQEGQDPKVKLADEHQSTFDFFAGVESYEVVAITRDGVAMEQTKVIFQPYQTTCQIGEKKGENLTFALLPKWGKQVCFSLSSHYCRLQEVACWEEK